MLTAAPPADVNILLAPIGEGCFEAPFAARQTYSGDGRAGTPGERYEMNENRRQFLRTVTAAGSAALSGAPAILAQRSPNDVLGVASIGVGTRGYQLLSDVQKCPNTEVRVIADLYDGHIALQHRQGL